MTMHVNSFHNPVFFFDPRVKYVRYMYFAWTTIKQISLTEKKSWKQFTALKLYPTYLMNFHFHT